jgi:plasmid stability protein
MVEVKIRKLPDWVVATFKSRAARAGRSLEEELRDFLTEEASWPESRRAAELRAFRRMLRRKYGLLADSSGGIRKERAARG